MRKKLAYASAFVSSPENKCHDIDDRSSVERFKPTSSNSSNTGPNDWYSDQGGAEKGKGKSYQLE